MPSPYLELEIVTQYLIGPDAERLCRSVIRLPHRQQTLTDILRLKLSQEVQAFNERRTECYGTEYLTPEELDEIRSEGRRLAGNPLKKGKANPDMEFKLLLRAFAEHRFKVIVDGVETSDVMTRLTPTAETKILVVRVTPHRI